MSRNLELLSQLEAEFPIESTATSKVATSVSTADRDGHKAVDQEFATLAQTVFLSRDGNAPRQVVVCGVDRDSGSSEICIHLGRALAKYSTRPVCLIDGNLRSTHIEKFLNTERLTPLPVPDADLCRNIEPNLWLAELVAPGSRNGTGSPPAQELKARVAALRARFDFILIDAPGANAGGEASVLGQLSDGAILVVEANSTRKAAALRAKQSLQETNVRILGSVLNNRTFPIPERLYRKL